MEATLGSKSRACPKLLSGENVMKVIGIKSSYLSSTTSLKTIVLAPPSCQSLYTPWRNLVLFACNNKHG